METDVPRDLLSSPSPPYIYRVGGQWAALDVAGEVRLAGARGAVQEYPTGHPHPEGRQCPGPLNGRERAIYISNIHHKWREDGNF